MSILLSVRRLRIINMINKQPLPSRFHVGLIFPLGLPRSVNATQHLGASSLDVSGTFSLTHQAAADKHRPHVNLIPLATVRSGSVRRENLGGSGPEQERTLRRLRPANSLRISRHDALKWTARQNGPRWTTASGETFRGPVDQYCLFKCLSQWCSNFLPLGQKC